MKKQTIWWVAALCVGIFYACGNSSSHSFQGTFVSDTGMKVELRADSTTYIQFRDSSIYEGTWAAYEQADADSSYATIEFAGKKSYFYLKDGKLYRSKREMDKGILGIKIEYQE